MRMWLNQKHVYNLGKKIHSNSHYDEKSAVKKVLFEQKTMKENENDMLLEK